MAEKLVGSVTRVFPRLGCVGIRVTDDRLTPGTQVRFKCEASRRKTPVDFTQSVISLHVNKAAVDCVPSGKVCGFKVAPGEILPHRGTSVYLIT